MPGVHSFRFISHRRGSRRFGLSCLGICCPKPDISALGTVQTPIYGCADELPTDLQKSCWASVSGCAFRFGKVLRTPEC
jgi:hypothetical protein